MIRKLLGRTTILLAALATAGAGPYLVSDSGWRNALQQRWNEWTAAPSRDSNFEPLTDPVASSHSGSWFSFQRPRPVTEDLPPTNSVVYDLPGVIRFDITPEWLIEHWPRVSTSLYDGSMEGFRVALITGTAENDLAGALTYYFDTRHQLQRITFNGYTGQTDKIINFVQQYYRLQREPAVGSELYLTRWNGVPTSALRIQHRPVVRAEMAHSRVEISFELNRPNVNFGLSTAFREVLSRELTSRRL